MKIRPAGPEDVQQVVSLVTGILKDEFPEDTAAYPANDLYQLLETYGGNRNLFLVAEDGDRVIGTCGVKMDSSSAAILRRLFVDSEYRRQGVGKELLRQALAFCRKAGYSEVIIRTSSRMAQAVRLCSSFGFQEDGQWTLGGLDLMLLRLRIS